MNPYEQKIKKAREENFSDYQIFQQLKEDPEIQQKYAQAEESGIKSNEVDSFLSERYGLKPKTPKTLMQSVYSGLASNPLAWGIEKVVGENPVSDSLRDVSKSFANAPAHLLSLPRNIVDFPGNLVQSSEDYWNQQPEDQQRNPNLIRGITDPIAKGLDYALDKTGIKGLVDENLPNYDEASAYFRQPEDAPKSHAGKFTERSVGGFSTAGPIGAVAGAADYIAEEVNLSPEYRALMSFMLRKADQGPKTIYGEILPKEPIQGPGDLAARMLTFDKDAVNFPVIKAAAELNIPIETIPLQALYKTGMPNLIEGVGQNSMIGSGRFNSFLNDFSGEMSTQLNKVIDAMPMDVGMNEVTTVQQLGELPFENPVKTLVQDVAPQIETPKYETGKIGKNAIQQYDQDITSRYNDLYNQVKFTEKDVLDPRSADYTALQDTIKKVTTKLDSEGFVGPERKEALSVLSDVQSLFGEDNKPIPLETLRKNVQDLSKKVNYQHPSMINLIEPVIGKMRNIIEIASNNNPNLSALKEANKLFREKSEFFKDPLMKKLNGLTDEQFYKTVRSNPSYLKKFQEFSEQTGQTEAFTSLKNRILGDILEKILNAKNPKELASAINDKALSETRELQQFFPELPELSKTLQVAKHRAKEFSAPKEMAKSKAREMILSDIMSASGMEQTLKLMNNAEGIDLVRETLKGTKEGKEILKSLERKKVEQLLYDGPKKQEIDLVELGKVFNDSKKDILLKKLLPEENYKQAKNLSKIAEEYQKGIESHSNIKKKFDTGVGLGLIPALMMAPTKTVIGIGTLAYYLTSKNFRKMMAENAKRQYDARQNPNP